MKFVNLRSSAKREDLLDAIKSSGKVNENVKFDEKMGRPAMKVKEKGSTLYVTCELIGGAGGKDNGFLIGTFFLGSLKEKDGESRLRGIILTAPLYHLALIAFCVYFLVQSFIVGGITLVPLLLVGFSYFLYKSEFKKQGIIKRFFARAAKYAEQANLPRRPVRIGDSGEILFGKEKNEPSSESDDLSEAQNTSDTPEEKA